MRIEYNSMSELGTNTINQLQNLLKVAEKAGTLVVEDMPLFSFTGAAEKYHVLERIKIQIQLEQCRANIMQERQKQGIQRAKEEGVQFGRKPKEMPLSFPFVYEQYKSDRLSQRQAAEKLGVSNHTFAKWVRNIEGRNI